MPLPSPAPSQAANEGTQEAYRREQYFERNVEIQMNNIWKRSLSLAVALFMIIGMIPFNVLAEEVTTPESPAAEAPVEPTGDTSPDAAPVADETGDPTVWDGISADTTWADAEPYVIDSAADLAGLAQLVNAGNNFSGKTITLAANIDLANKEWTPIGSAKATSFRGTFDGQSHTISNLKVSGTNNFAGLFGYLGSGGGDGAKGTIRNINIRNADVSGAAGVAAVAGYGNPAVIENCNVTGTIKITSNNFYSGVIVGGYIATVKNCHVSGDITIDAYGGTGGIAGYGYWNISDCSVIGNDGSSISGTSYVGGIAGWTGEGAHTVTNCSVANIAIRGVDTTGGIVGMANYGVTVIDSSVDGLTITTTGTDNTAGAIAGTVNGTSDQPSLLANDTVTNTTVNAVATTAQTSGLTSAGVANTNYAVGENVVLDDSGKVLSGDFSVMNDTVAAAIVSSDATLTKNEDGTFSVAPAVTYAAYINGVGYDSLEAAVNAVEKNAETATTITLSAGTHVFPNSGIYANKKIVFQGAEGVIIDATGLGNEVYGDEITFNDVTINWPGTSHKGITHTNKVVFNNCAFTGTQTLYAADVDFNSCTFTVEGNNYAVWTYGCKDVTFTDCTFSTDGKAILAYTEDPHTASITVSKCEFTATTNRGKAAVELGQSDNGESSYTATITESTADTNFVANHTESNLWGNKNDMTTASGETGSSVTIDGTQVMPTPKVAYIGETGYATLAEAIAAAGSDETAITLVAGTYSLTGSLANKNITFTGTGNAADVIIEMYSAINASGSTVNFDGVTVKFDNDNYEGLQHSNKVTYTNCTHIGTEFLYAPKVSYTGCTFEMYDKKTEYAVWTYGAKDVTFTDCTFNTNGKAVLVYTEAAHSAEIALSDCEFNSNGTYTGKAAVEIGASANGAVSDYDLSFTNCTADENFSANNTESNLWGNKNSITTASGSSVVIDGGENQMPAPKVAYIGETGYASIQAAIDAAGTEDVITLLCDVTINAVDGQPETHAWVKAEDNVIIDLNGHTVTGAFFINGTAIIKNGTIVNTSMVSGIESQGNLTLENMTVTSNRHAVRISGGTATIVSGTYQTTGSSGTRHVVNASGATTVLDIQGGTFIGAGFAGNGANGNCVMDQGIASATISGGTFYGANGVEGPICPASNTLISGGTFTDTTETWRYTASTAEGKIAVKNADGTYTVVDATVKNTTTGKLYGSLADAINAAASGDEIVLLSSITESGITVAADDDVIIDLGGYTVTGDFMVYGKATIKNGAIDSNNTSVSAIEANGASADVTLENLTVTSERHGIRVDGAKLVTIISGSYTASSYASNHAVNISDGGAVIIKDGTFVGNTANGSAGIAIRDDSSKLTINGGTFTGGAADLGSLTVWSGTATVTGGTFASVYNDREVAISGGHFETVNKLLGNAISNGTFGADVSDYCVEGKVAQLQSDGYYHIVDATVKNTTTGKYYATLSDALAASNEGDVITLLADVEWKTASTIGGSPLTDHSVTINGQGKYTLTATGDGIGSIEVTSGTLTLKDLTVVDKSVSYNESAWEMGYLEFDGNLVAENVIFSDPILFQGNEASFTGCTFTGKTNQYGCWIHSGEASFTGCTFTGTRGLKAHSAYGNVVSKLAVTGSTFNCTDKPGIALGDVANSTVTITNNTFDGVKAGDQNQFTFESDTPLDQFTLNRSGNTIVDVTSAEDVVAGTYEYDPTNYLAPDFKAIDNGNGTWTVVAKYYVAQVGDRKFESLQEAIDAAKAGDTVEVIKDCAIDTMIIPTGVTLDMNDNAVTAQYVIGLNGSKITGNPRSADSSSFGKLVVPSNSFAMMTSEAYNDGVAQIAPVYSAEEGLFYFSRILPRLATGGLSVGEDNLTFKFTADTSGYLFNVLKNNGMSGTEMSLVVRLEWKTAEGDAYLDFVYNDTFIKAVFNGGKVFTLKLTGTDSLEMLEGSLQVKILFKTNSGVIVSSEAYK